MCPTVHRQAHAIDLEKELQECGVAGSPIELRFWLEKLLDIGLSVWVTRVANKKSIAALAVKNPASDDVVAPIRFWMNRRS